VASARVLLRILDVDFHDSRNPYALELKRRFTELVRNRAG
jgi:hypothetical protein